MGEAAKKQKVLVTGAGGQLGQEFVRLDVPGIQFVGVDRQVMDITDSVQCVQVMERIVPDTVIHCAAYTAVDRVETDEERAWQINAVGTENVARAAEAIGAKLCYISTDYVFDGNETQPYLENASTAPQTVYGRTKLAGEKLAQELCSQVFIVRTSWLYGYYGNNFVNTMLRLGQHHQELKVVNDQTGSPTYTLDIVKFIAELVQTHQYGVYHASNSGSCTWYDFARAIFEEAGLNNKITVIPCQTKEFPRPAPRPAYSVLAHDALLRAGFEPMRHWRAALKEFLKPL